MKKIFVFIFSIFVVSFNLFSEKAAPTERAAKSHTIMFSESTLENGIYDQSDFWITDKIRANLLSLIQRYGGLNCVDLNEAKNILKVQRQLDSIIFDDSQSIEIGKLIKAKEILNIKTTRFPSGSYSINITLFNVETGVILGMFSSPKTYESAESYALQAHYDCILDILSRLGIQLTTDEKNALQNEKKIAAAQAIKNKEIAAANAKIEEERSEKSRLEAERRAKIAAEEREKREAIEKAEAAAAQKALEEKKAKDAEIARKAKIQNPFANTTYSCEFENGSRYDSYKIKFISQNECSVTVTSIDSKGNEKSVTKSGSYSFGNEILSINVRMQNDQVRHVQKIQWKGQVSFKNGYNNFYMVIPVSSAEDAKKIRMEFHLK